MPPPIDLNTMPQTRDERPHSDRITLNVGGRRFDTTRETLMGGSTYFAVRLSEQWPSETDEDGSYFVDASDDLFEHILSYLRTGTFPILFDMDTLRFDLVKYSALLGEARFFEIGELAKWIQDQKFKSVVTVTYQAQFFDEVRQRNVASGSFTEKMSGAAKIETHLEKSAELVYRCPRDPMHHGQNDCTERCLENAGRSNGWMEKPISKALVVSTRVNFNFEVANKR
ncbi:BTB/POZ protein [Truncatella angustata]|jgi:hypothetical protein|uniref:BTB/POZ protein n=1 Tax=Truncatella angustata TaxID=152316 RepID=A0A9P8ZZG3_9PEZI|nr:BTB/POZ protein [Truncatella angustata]KAH6654984.1 BTB/POZ protein [Truncatella angustata]KAH8204076.1 hypothetical protein TruAng_001758 [Truncatella angustata]